MALGPTIVSMLRQAEEIGGVPIRNTWRTKLNPKDRVSPLPTGETGWVDHGDEMGPVSDAILEVVRNHNNAQPESRKIPDEELEAFFLNGLQMWRLLSDRHGKGLLYNEWTLHEPARSPVVLGSEGHALRNIDQVFHNAPTSMREVEETMNFRSREDRF